MGGVRKIYFETGSESYDEDSESGSDSGSPPNFDSESGSSSVPISAMLLHIFYIHHIIHTKSGSRSVCFPKNSNPDQNANPDPIGSGSVPISGRQLDFRVTPTHFAVMHSRRRQKQFVCLFFFGRGRQTKFARIFITRPNMTDLVGKFYMQIELGLWASC